MLKNLFLKQKKALIQSLFLFISLYSTAQNLVPNPGFEKFVDCPDNIGQVFLASPWYSANTGTPEYFNTTCDFFEDAANKGNGFAGLIVYSQYEDAVEYIASPLTATLEADEEYCLSMYVRAKHSPYYVDKMAVLLSESKIVKKYWTPIVSTDALILKNHIFIKPENNWVKLSATFIAKGNESFITIGNFTPFNTLKSEPDRLVNTTDGWYIYMYIDDILLERITPGYCCSCPDTIPIEIVEKTNTISLLNKTASLPSSTLYFDFNSYEINYLEFQKLETIIYFLQQNNHTTATIKGHTDYIGSDEYNMFLSKKRAENIYQILLNKQINPAQLKIEYYGKNLPVNHLTDEIYRKENRRVEIIIE
jgi:OOP family OmpA-OmpF porin